jgi:hypothetical protein
METPESIRARVIACPERLDDGNEWSFYLINDSNVPLDSAVLYSVSYEWGDWGRSDKASVRVTALAPGAHALIWRDDGSGAELRMELSLRVHACGRDTTLRFEFPKLYRLQHLSVMDGLGKTGWPVSAVG